MARSTIEKNDRLGKHRRVAGFGKLRMRFERALDTPLALLNLACIVIYGRFVDPFC
ncbi:hypothetical protein [Ralstonia pseudosolanacearum]